MTYDVMDGVHLSPTPRLLKTKSIHVMLSSLHKSMQRNEPPGRQFISPFLDILPISPLTIKGVNGD